MATFSTNQVRQLYVANALGTVKDGVAAGTIEVKSDTDKTNLYFKYMGPGGQVRSDLVDIKNISYIKVTDATKMVSPLSKYKVVLDSSVNSGAPRAGEDYILRIAFRNFVGLSEEDQYFKYGAVHAVSGMTAAQFYSILAKSLKQNMAREISPLVNVSLAGTKAVAVMSTNNGVTVTAKESGVDGNNIKFAVASIADATAGVVVTEASGVKTITASLTGANKTIGDLTALVAADPIASKLVVITGTAGTAVAAETTAVALTTGSTTGVIIEETEQPWVLGTMQQESLKFTVQPTTINDGTEERIWGVVSTETSTTSLKNGKKIADMEYFYMGERGDQYRGIGWPNVIKTTYLVDPSVEYNTIDIHYAYQGSGEDIQKSEKDITLVVPKVDNTLVNSIVSAINTATGLTIATL